MALQVIGAGFGRTGTMSLKLALDQLGFGPCYHMVEVFKNPAAPDYWAAAAAGAKMDWDQVFDGYRATVDWPSTDYWQALLAHAPAAKVILTVRDPQAWFRSTQATIFGPANDKMIYDPSSKGQMIRAIFDRHFGGKRDNQAACIAGYMAHNAAVRQGVPAAQLLEYDVAQGWAPLCAFLGVPMPDSGFPRVNSTEEFLANAARRQSAQP